jgi:hypothetical protein
MEFFPHSSIHSTDLCFSPNERRKKNRISNKKKCSLWKEFFQAVEHCYVGTNVYA